MKSLNPLVAVTLGLALAGCSNSEDLNVLGPAAPTGQSEASAKPSDSIPFVTLERNAQGPFVTPCTDLFETAGQWDAVMTMMAGNGEISILPAPEAPNVNWKHESVALVSLGELPSGASGVEVVAVHRQGTHAILDVVVTPAGPFTYLTAPYHLIKFENKGIQSVEIHAL